ncbi:MAG: PorP/SprF family type IX secretion system membrane protein [Flavobacteriia bacterium]|jgi:type IX secretion system PorP/SprF family membrane protein
MKSNFNKIIKFLLCINITGFTFAQDIHFSFSEASPMTVNPALVGSNNIVQGIVNYRTQWKSVAEPYQTFAASFDARLNDKKRKKKGIMAVGINFSSDEAGSLNLKSSAASLNLAYHLILSKNSKFGLGIYTGFGQRSIDPNTGRWGNQYDGSQFNSSLTSGETFNNASFSYLDAGSGICYNYRKGKGSSNVDKMTINCGLAAFHVNRPSNSFLEKNAEFLAVRWSSFVNANFKVKDSRLSIQPSVYFQRQNKASELVAGLYLKYELEESGGQKNLYFGLFDRFKDAFIVKGIMEINSYSIGFAYDLNTSSLSSVSKSRGAFEIFARFRINDGVKASF